MAATATPQRIDAPPHPRRGGPRDESGSAIAFFVATGILCLHVLDDNFLQPPPGTNAADHLLSGLVPIVLLLGIANIYPRLRAGVRGISALTIGLFGVVMGASEAGYYTLAEGPSGDDFTGLLAIPAGLTLIAIGTITLWTTRRTDDRLAAATCVGCCSAWAASRLPMCCCFRSSCPTCSRMRHGPAFPTPTRRRLRAGHVHDRRWFDIEGLVRAVQKRRRRDRGTGTGGVAEAGATARASRLRRPALRPARRGQERWRPQRLRVERRPRPPRRRRIPTAPTRRPERANRRDRTLRRRRSPPPSRRRVARTEGRRVRRRRLSLHTRGPREPPIGQMERHPHLARDLGGNGNLSPTRPHRRTSRTWWRTSRPGRCSSSTASTISPTYAD